ncbi:hypothetical protein LTR85_001632 [Meristemomyces frigidus]|nr:hypothetical protein LTR85_001632 [Meristemomyces frigidus]
MLTKIQNPARRARQKKKTGKTSSVSRACASITTALETQPKPTLLSLPGELRNHIYRFALLSPSRIPIGSDTLAQPSLLHACHQVRKEAKPIYYKENKFCVTITNFHFGLDMAFTRQCMPCRHLNVTAALVQIGQGSWQNLLNGLKACHEGSCGGLRYSEGEDLFWAYAARAFEMVKDLKSCPWPQVEKALDKYRLAVTEQPSKARTAWRPT